METNSYVTGVSDADGYFTIPTPPGTHDLYFTGNLATTNRRAGRQRRGRVLLEPEPGCGNATHITVSDGATTDVGTVTMDIGAIVRERSAYGVRRALGDAIVFAHDLRATLRAYTWMDAVGDTTA